MATYLFCLSFIRWVIVMWIALDSILFVSAIAYIIIQYDSIKKWIADNYKQIAAYLIESIADAYISLLADDNDSSDDSID